MAWASETSARCGGCRPAFLAQVQADRSRGGLVDPRAGSVPFVEYDGYRQIAAIIDKSEETLPSIR